MKKVRPSVKLLLAVVFIGLFVFVYWNQICPWGWSRLRGNEQVVSSTTPVADAQSATAQNPDQIRLDIVDLQARQTQIKHDLNKAHQWLSTHQTGDRYEDMDGMVYLYSEVREYAKQLARELDQSLGAVMVLQKKLTILEGRPAVSPDEEGQPVPEVTNPPDDDPMQRLKKALKTEPK